MVESHVVSISPAEHAIRHVIGGADPLVNPLLIHHTRHEVGGDDAIAVVGLVPAGCIILWAGATGAIPAGWLICDGNNYTPDLRDKFVVGAGSTYAVDATGGTLTHNHGSAVGDGAGAANFATTSTKNHLPPYHALCYIMKT